LQNNQNEPNNQGKAAQLETTEAIINTAEAEKEKQPQEQ